MGISGVNSFFLCRLLLDLVVDFMSMSVDGISVEHFTHERRERGRLTG